MPATRRVPIRRNPITDFPAPNSDPLAVIGYVINVEASEGSAVSSVPDDLNLYAMVKLTYPVHLFRRWGTAFIATCLSELRKIICGDGKTPKKLSGNSQAGIVALATFLAQQFGLTSATATGLAVLVFIKVGQAAKTALCKTTDKDFLASLEKSADQSEENPPASARQKPRRSSPKRKK